MNRPDWNTRIDRNTRRALERELKDLPTTRPPADLLDRIRQEIPATPGASNADDDPTAGGARRRPRAARWLSLAAMLAVGALGVTLAYRVSHDSGGADSLAIRPASPPAPQAAPTVRSSEALATGESAANEVGGARDENVLLKEETDDQALAGRRRVGEGGEVEAKAAPLPDQAPQPPAIPPPVEAADGDSNRPARPDGIGSYNMQSASVRFIEEQRKRLEKELRRTQASPVPAAPATGAPAAAPSQEASRLGGLEEPRRQMTGAEDAEKSRRDATAGIVSESESVARRAPQPEPEPVPSPAPPADMYFRDAGTNPFVDAREDRLSTFALDVDTGAWTLARSYLERGMLPPREAIRVEEFVNAQRYEDPAPRRGEFTLTAEGAPSPFVPDDRYRLLRFAVKAREVDAYERKPANLTFVIDVSGSMDRENRLGLVKRALGLLLDELDSEDRVGLVVYGSRGRVLLEHTRDHEAIRDAIRRLVPEGSTNAEEGLRLGYDLADQAWREGWINRIILCSDGVANVGATGPESILARIGKEARRGIALTTVGFGMGNYNDELMEQLADQGDGSYHYVDQLDEARRVFVENLSGTLQTVAKDAKVQVEFDPRSVERWRLVGYENRDVADRDFRNDRIDAGEVGAGQSATAVYEVRLSEEARAGDPLATLRLRWKSVDGGRVVEADQELTVGDVGRSFDRASRDLRVAAIAADFAERLKGTRYSRDGSWSDLLAEARHLRRELPRDATVTELARLVERAAGLAGDGSDSDRRRME
jgi:Ca-activated chloride channel family protein